MYTFGAIVAVYIFGVFTGAIIDWLIFYKGE